MKMDEHDGKQFLATVRSADYAHAGEAESIDLAFATIAAAQPEWRVLDVGCGRGGTADYVNRHGWGHVVGVDIDSDAVEYAQNKFPNIEFSICNMHQVGERFPNQFDLIYLFNVFYAASNKPAALASFRQSAKPGATLCIFDYVFYKPAEKLPAVFVDQRPITPEDLAKTLKDASWEAYVNRNLDQEYIEWYRKFLESFDDPTLTKAYSRDVIESVRVRYMELLNSLENGVLGGVLLLAHAQ
jgi:SAM-dependent methyltransferase